MKDEMKLELALRLLGINDLVENVDTVASHLIGKVCMFRTRSAGVHFGELAAKNGQECLVKDARRVWYWAKACSLSQLAMEGDKDLSNCKIAMPVKEIVLDQVIEVILMTKESADCLYGAPLWKK